MLITLLIFITLKTVLIQNIFPLATNVIKQADGVNHVISQQTTPTKKTLLRKYHAFPIFHPNSSR